MTRQEATERWMYIARCVFTAENNIYDKLDKVFNSDMDFYSKSDMYLKLIAEEILSGTTDEELEKMTL